MTPTAILTIEFNDEEQRADIVEEIGGAIQDAIDSGIIDIGWSWDDVSQAARNEEDD